MTWFTASSVSVTNGATVVSVNTGDDIQIAQEAGGLIIGTNPPVEIKRTYLDGSSNKKIELRSAWPYATQSGQPAVAFPTDGDLAAATAVLKQLIDGFAISTQVQAEAGTDNNTTMTPLRTKQAINAQRPATASSTDTTPGRFWRTNDLVKTTSATDSTAGRMLKVGDFGLGADLNNQTNSDNIPYSNLFVSNTANSTNAFSGDYYGLNFSRAGALRRGNFVMDAGLSEVRIGARRFDGSAWSPWREIYHNANILGTVSQTAGVPTGAIIEVSSSPSGTYIKYADGTLICFFSSTVEYQTNGGVPVGGLYPSAGQNFFFPATFSSAPTIVSACLALSGFVTQSSYLLTTTTFSAELWGNATTNTGRMGYIAIGRWY